MRKGWKSVYFDKQNSGNVHGGRKRAVGRLRMIHIVVGWIGFWDPISPPAKLDGAIANHLIDVHVGLGARAGLPH